MKIVFYLQALETQGIQILIAILKNNGHDCKILFDPSLHDYFHAKFDFFKKLDEMVIKKQIEELVEYDPDIFCFSFITAQFYDTLEMFKKLKASSLKDKIFIAGGIHTSARPTEILEFGFDYICVGDGEIALLSLIKNLEKGIKEPKVNGIWYKRGEKIINNGVGDKILNIDKIPLPDTEAAKVHGFLYGDSYYYMTSRGCIYACKFCFNNFYNMLYGNKNIIRRKSSSRVIRDLKKYGKKFKKIIFMDDLFLFDRKWNEKFFKLYNKEIKKPFVCSARLESIDTITCKLIKPYCEFVHLGIESGSKKIREKILGRRYSNQFLMDKVRLMKHFGIKLKASFMFGLPNEYKEDMMGSVILAKSINPYILSTYIFTPMPGSEIFNNLEKKSLLTNDSFKISTHFYGERFKGQRSDDAFVISNLLPLMTKLRIIEPLCMRMINHSDEKYIQKTSHLLYKLYLIFFQKIYLEDRAKVFIKQIFKSLKYICTNEKRFS